MNEDKIIEPIVDEQADMLGIPKSEQEATRTSTVGRYVDIPEEVAGYPGKYEEGIAKRQKSYKYTEEAALIENNNQL